jgi:hypothetical protein
MLSVIVKFECACFKSVMPSRLGKIGPNHSPGYKLLWTQTSERGAQPEISVEGALAVVKPQDAPQPAEGRVRRGRKR